MALMRPRQATWKRSSKGSLGALVAACQLARERQEALDEHLAVDRIALIEVAREQRAILLGAAIAHADSPGGGAGPGHAPPTLRCRWSISCSRRAAALTGTLERAVRLCHLSPCGSLADSPGSASTAATNGSSWSSPHS